MNGPKTSLDLVAQIDGLPLMPMVAAELFEQTVMYFSSVWFPADGDDWLVITQ